MGWPRSTLVRRVLFGLMVACFVAMCTLSAESLAEKSATLSRLGTHANLLGAAGVGGLVFMAALTWLAYRYPTITIMAVLALLPLRLPLPFGGDESNLLIPLYLLTLAMAFAEIVFRDRLALPPDFRRDPTRIALAVMIAVMGVSSLWVGYTYAPRRISFAAALIKLFAFIVPFSLLYYLVERHVSSRLRLTRLVWALLASGAVLALLGIVQSVTGWVIVNRDGVLHNEEMQHAFRANSLFWDPNMFGRFCALVVLLGIACFLALRAGGYRSRWRRALPLTAAALAATALALTLSRSGLIALIAGAFVVELAWLGRKKGLIAVAVTLLVLIAGLAAITTVRDTTQITEKIQSTRGLNKLTGGRVYLLKAGWRMYERHPVRGIGLAGFPKAYPSYRRTHAASLNLRESHTTPMTIAAEQGTVGLLAYGALLVTFFATTLRKKRFGAARDLYLLQAGIVAGVAAICVSSLVYNAFFEDPYLWVFMALAGAVATRLVHERSTGTAVATAPRSGAAGRGDQA